MKGLMDDKTRLNIRSGQAGNLKSSKQAKSWWTRKVKLMEATCSGADKNSAIKELSAKIHDSDQINKFGRTHTGLGDICCGNSLLY